MSEKICPLCNGTGWVCEFHLDIPWNEGEGCGCGGAGANCICNPNGDVPEGFLTIASVDDEKPKTWMQ